MVVSLNHFNEQCRSVLHVLGEDLQQIPIFVVIDQNFQLLQYGQILLYLHTARLEPLAQLIVLVITIERNAEYSVWIWLSSTDQNRWNMSIFSYHAATDSICKSG
uniref:Uncharacterized protein n=1 Tax=Anopheles culicifacies TaxID=139723 RepID=A0A182LXF1_9DIPT